MVLKASLLLLATLLPSILGIFEDQIGKWDW